jgi:hypothetical protein
MGLFEVQRKITATSSALTVEHLAVLRPGVDKVRGTARLMDSDLDGRVSAEEQEKFIRSTADHLLMDFVVLASRQGPAETEASMAVEPLPATLVRFETFALPDPPTTAPLGFRQSLRVDIPPYLATPFSANADSSASLVLSVIDPVFMATIQGLEQRKPDAAFRVGTRLDCHDPAITLNPPPGEASHELSLRLRLAKAPKPVPGDTQP